MNVKLKDALFQKNSDTQFTSDFEKKLKLISNQFGCQVKFENWFETDVWLTCLFSSLLCKFVSTENSDNLNFLHNKKNTGRRSLTDTNMLYEFLKWKIRTNTKLYAGKTARENSNKEKNLKKGLNIWKKI